MRRPIDTHVERRVVNHAMAHTNPTADQLRDLLTGATTIAIVGASSNPDRPAHGIMRKLQSAEATRSSRSESR